LRALQDGRTPLFTASNRGHTEVVGALLAKGADVEAKADVSMTPSRMDAPACAAVHQHACETLAAGRPVLVTDSRPYLERAIRREAVLHNLFSQPCQRIWASSVITRILF
jgi:ankyrin repeat protein